MPLPRAKGKLIERGRYWRRKFRGRAGLLGRFQKRIIWRGLDQMTSTWGTIVAATGIGGLGCFVIWSLYKQWLSLPIFDRMGKAQTFVLMLVFLLLVFGVAIFAIYTGWGNGKMSQADNGPTKPIADLDLYVRRSKSGTVERFPLIQSGQLSRSLPVNPLSGGDNFKVSATFSKPTSVTAVWVDTKGKSTVVQSASDARSLEYPSNGAFVAPDLADPPGYEAILLVSPPRPTAIANSELTHALDGLIPPTQLVDQEQIESRGPGVITDGNGPSFLAFQEQARSRLPRELTLLKVIFVPKS
jgi:hypothetical protein